MEIRINGEKVEVRGKGDGFLIRHEGEKEWHYVCRNGIRAMYNYVREHGSLKLDADPSILRPYFDEKECLECPERDQCPWDLEK